MGTSHQVCTHTKHGIGSLTGNNLDYWVRQGQADQTNGIPIGPDSSHIIAKTIGSDIDLEIEKKLKKWPVGYKNVADFFLCFETAQEADEALAASVAALSEFELQINPDKTKIVPIAEYID